MSSGVSRRASTGVAPPKMSASRRSGAAATSTSKSSSINKKSGSANAATPPAVKVAGNVAPALVYPAQGPSSVDPLSHLQPFRDDSSEYAAVAKACLHLTQYFACGSNAQISTDDNPASSSSSAIISSVLTHDNAFAETASSTFSSLMECIQSHKDRKCRMLACTTLAVIARSSYARLRPSPLLYAVRDLRVHRVEDEVGMDVPSTLITAALQDQDDGVSATAVQALGILTLSSQPMLGSLVEDEFWQHVQGIAFCRVAPYSPTLRACAILADEDPAIAQTELTTRIFENTMAPRLVQLLDRVFLYSSKTLVAMTVPCITQCLVHQIKTTPAAMYGMDKQTFAKRWVEVDVKGLTNAYVESLLLPHGVQFATDGALSHAAAVSLIRLANAYPDQAWTERACLWAARIFQEELSAGAGGSNNTNPAVPTKDNYLALPLESKLAILAALVISLRGIPVDSSERANSLGWLAGVVAALPSTSIAPLGIAACPGVLVEVPVSSIGGNVSSSQRAGTKKRNETFFRRPARIALWTEIALLYFMDGPDSDNENARPEMLSVFLKSPTLTTLLTDVKIRQLPVLSPYHELLLAFTTVAADAGRRFRTLADGTLLFTDPEIPKVTEWVKMAWIVLTTFISCTTMGHKVPFLEDDFSMLAAGQASYTRLLQEYLFMVGLISPDTSVAFKLTANACPPNLLWDQMSQSASLLARFDPVDIPDAEAVASKVVDELVARENNKGCHSHDMRMFLLTLAADSWIQGRMVTIRKQFEASAAPAETLTLKEQSALGILMAISPKRLLSKIFDSYKPPADPEGKRKRDPVKKIGQETVKAAVACIEGIALMACDWRRRFGPSKETKSIVSLAVGLLQGKADETPVHESMKAILASICEAAVARIQAFYEKGGGGAADTSFPVSDLVAQHVKPKIKPLVSPAKPSEAPRDKLASWQMTQLCRQVIAARIEQSILSVPPADSHLTPARPRNCLRLSAPPVPESMDARVLGAIGLGLSAWGKQVTLSSSSSDAVALIAAYTPRRFFRNDGEEEFRTTLLVRAFNTTPIVLVDGLRLDLGLSQKHPVLEETDDHVSLEVIASLGGDMNELVSDGPLLSSSAVYKQEIKGGEYITWEVSLDQLAALGTTSFVPAVVYRNLKAESLETGAKWVGEKSSTSGDASTATPGSKAGEDDFQVTTSDKGMKGGDEEKVETVTLPGEPFSLSPLAGLQPCPVTFFRDALGDAVCFRFFWFQMPFHVAAFELKHEVPSEGASPVDKKLSEAASLSFSGEPIPGGEATKLWAFSAIRGGRAFCILAETEGGGAPTYTLHLRGDDQRLLYSLAGTKSAREQLVAALCPDMVPA